MRLIISIFLTLLYFASTTTLKVNSDVNSESQVPSSIRALYLSYLSRFSKSEDRLLDPRRIESFRACLELIDSHARKQPRQHFQLGLNEMSDWLPEELQALFATTAPAPASASAPAPASARGAVTLSHYQSNSGGLRPLKEDDRADNKTTTQVPSAAIVPSPVPALAPSLAPVSLNWASSDNRLGHSIVPPVRNQGSCGACWAFVAVAAIEASVHLNSQYQLPLPLSAQQLIDCDTADNRGCQGGNPFYAFEYAKVVGITAWNDYPYKEKPGVCQRAKFKSRASLEGPWRITASDQRALFAALQSAPVAIGICGTDQRFIYYSGGVLDAADCCVTQNHALLIVGHGHDAAQGLDYWLAQNSWGAAWGEKGLIRLKRTSEPGPGQCGLASSPCQAIGGYIMNPELGGAGEGGAATGSVSVLDSHRLALRIACWWDENGRDALLAGSLFLLVLSVYVLLTEQGLAAEEASRLQAGASAAFAYESVDIAVAPVK